MEHLTVNVGGNGLLVRREVLDGRTYVVAPAVMMVEGVLDGSDGPGFYPEKVIAASDALWDKSPVVVAGSEHPKNAAGRLVRVKPGKADPNDRPVNSTTAGFLAKVKTENKAQSLECWLDEQKTNAADAAVVASLDAGKSVGVSTGVVVEKDYALTGNYGGKAYAWTATGLDPDHLAVLVNKPGACSVKDGCAIGVTGNCGCDACKQTATGNAAAELSLSDLRRAVCAALAAKFGDTGYPSGYVEDIYDSYFVYALGGKLWSLGYARNDDGTVSTSGEPEQVVLVTQYRKASGGAVVGNATGRFLSEWGDEMTKKEKVDALIANAATGWAEADRAFLDGLDDAKLDKVSKSVVVTTAPPPTGNVADSAKLQAEVDKANAAVAAFVSQHEAAKTQNPRDYIANAAMPPDLRAIFSGALDVAEAEKDGLIEGIVANCEHLPAGVRFTKEFLSLKQVPELRGIAALAGVRTGSSNPVPMFLGAGGGASPVTANTTKEEPLVAADLFSAKKSA